MSIVRKAVPLILTTSFLTGCAGLQKTDWPMCAAVGGVGGAALGAIESSTWAGGGALVGAGMAAAYCWVHGAGAEEMVMVEDVIAQSRAMLTAARPASDVLHQHVSSYRRYEKKPAAGLRSPAAAPGQAPPGEGQGACWAAHSWAHAEAEPLPAREGVHHYEHPEAEPLPARGSFETSCPL